MSAVTDMGESLGLIDGYVKYTPQAPKDYGNGPRINALITTDGGAGEVRVWGKPGDAVLESLTRGQKVTLKPEKGRGHKVYYRIVETHEGGEISEVPPAANGSGQINRIYPFSTMFSDDEEAEKLTTEETFRVKMYARIHKQVFAEYTDDAGGEPIQTISDEDIRQIATTVFISMTNTMQDLLRKQR
jgi:hypothetical protein